MNTNLKQTLTASNVAEVVVPCPELDQTLSFFVDQLGFRVEMITPADNPNTAIVSGFG
ncbi:MAG: cupin, partial [Actinobacteria bacterium]|nr:cupin [Actinomycetota bacterium]